MLMVQHLYEMRMNICLLYFTQCVPSLPIDMLILFYVKASGYDAASSSASVYPVLLVLTEFYPYLYQCQ